MYNYDTEKCNGCNFLSIRKDECDEWGVCEFRNNPESCSKNSQHMSITLNSIDGIADAISTMYLSKRNWNATLDKEIRDVVNNVTNRNGSVKYDSFCKEEYANKYNYWMDLLLKIGKNHITLLKFVDLSFTIQNIHRGGQDDIDSHTKRFDNRIIRSSTRLAEYDYEISDFYKDKVIPTDEALKILNVNIPDIIEVNGEEYIKSTNGYIKKDFSNNKDVKRGLYMLSIPSTFIFRCNLAEFSHVYKERCNEGTANPEVKKCIEKCVEEVNIFQPLITKEYLKEVKN